MYREQHGEYAYQCRFGCKGLPAGLKPLSHHYQALVSSLYDTSPHSTEKEAKKQSKMPQQSKLKTKTN